MRGTVEAIIKEIKEDGRMDPIQRIKVDYGLLLLKNEGIKFILLLVLFGLVDKGWVFLFCAGLLIPVRLFSGGLHMKTNLTCFLFSFVFFTLAILALPMLQVSHEGYFLLLVLSVVSISLCSPIATSAKPIVSKEKYQKCRAKAILAATLAVLLLLCMERWRSFYVCGVWTLFLQSLQLIAAYLFHRKEGLQYEKM